MPTFNPLPSVAFFNVTTRTAPPADGLVDWYATTDGASVLEKPSVTLSMHPAGVGETEVSSAAPLPPGSLCDVVAPLKGHDEFGAAVVPGALGVLPAGFSAAVFELDEHDAPNTPTASAMATKVIPRKRMPLPFPVRLSSHATSWCSHRGANE